MDYTFSFPNEVLEFPAEVTGAEIRHAIFQRLGEFPFGPNDLRIAAGFTWTDYPGGPQLVKAGNTIFGIPTI